MHAQIVPRISADRTPLQDVIPLSTPYLVFLDLSDLCNFRCRFCPFCGKELEGANETKPEESGNSVA